MALLILHYVPRLINIDQSKYTPIGDEYIKKLLAGDKALQIMPDEIKHEDHGEAISVMLAHQQHTTGFLENLCERRRVGA